MTFLRRIIFLQLTPILALGQLSSQSKLPALPEQPGIIVRRLYSEVVAHHPAGIPVDADIKTFAPYLSKSLLHGIDLAQACQRDYYRTHQNYKDKPELDWLEFGLFTGGNEKVSPGTFRVEKTEPENDGSFRVYVRLIWGPPSKPWIWQVAAIVTREEGRFVVDDIVFLKDENTLDPETRLSEILKSGCSGSHWIGYGEQRADLQQRSASPISFESAELKQGFDFVTSCKSGVAIQADSSGFSSVSLVSAARNWKRLPERILDVGPVVANHVVGVITESHTSLYAYSENEGRFLWNKEIHSNVLASDEKYFYITRSENSGISALDPLSGRVMWSLKIPRPSTVGPYLDFLTVADGFLYTDSYVVDLSKRAAVHFWPDDPHVISIEPGDNGEILVGDSSGKISIYDKQFKLVRSIEAGEGFVTQLASVNKGFLAVTYDQPSMSTQGSLVFLDPNRHSRWQFPWTSNHWLNPQPFTVAGASVLVIEPGAAKDKFRMASRRLSDGNLNWTTSDGDFFGPPVVCGSEVYVKEGDQIRAFGLQTGVEQKSNMVGSARPVRR